MRSEKPHAQQKRHWFKKSIPWAIVVIVLGGGGASYFALHGRASAATLNTRWMTVQKGNVQQTVSLSGTLNPANEVSLTGNGKIDSISVKDGDKVQAGQVIAQLDTSSYTPQLQEAEASLKSANAKLAQTEEPIAVQTGKKGTTTQSPDPNSIAQAEASVEQAQAQVNSVEQQITACTIKSPIAGTVLEVESSNQTGAQSTASSTSSTGATNSTSSGNTIAMIADLSPSDFVVQADVDQSDAANIHAGQTADISLGTSNGQNVTGKVESISYVPQTQSGVTTYPVTIQLSASKTLTTKLLPGQSVTASIVENQASNVLMLPTSALTQRGGTSGVYVRSSSASGASSTQGSTFSGQQIPSGLQFQPVTVGLYGGNSVEIKSGLTVGEQVAVLLPSAITASASQKQNASNGSGGMGMMGGSGGLQSGFSVRGSYGGGDGSGSGSGGRTFSGGSTRSFSGGGNG